MSFTLQATSRITSGAARFFSTSTARRADYTHAVIGAGVVGLAIARQLAARPGTSTVLIERHGSVGTETSSRNSEVIHAGLYYGHGSLKTKLCVQGKKMLYQLCAEKGIPHLNTKKWIIAQDAQQMSELQKLHDFATSIHVPTRFLSRSEIQAREPDVRAQAGVLESPTTGIIDSHALMSYLESSFQSRGGDLALHTTITGIEPLDNGNQGYNLLFSSRSTTSTPTSSSIQTKTLINSTGNSAPQISNLLLPPPRHLTPHYAKGTYYTYSSPFPKPRTLLYPAPTPGLAGLGTHLTLDLSGRIRFGPDVEWVADPDDLRPNARGLEAAIRVIREYLPGVREEAVEVGYCGIRPKVGRTSAVVGGLKGEVVAGGGFQDFIIREEEGRRGFVNLVAIESPGLTACLAIAEMVEGILYR